MSAISTIARDLLDAGRLAEAIVEQSNEVRAHPADPEARTFFFELLSFAGEFERARKQLDVLATKGVDAEIAVQAYRNIISAEITRQKVFEGKSRPRLGAPSPNYTETTLCALTHVAAAAFGQAAEALRAAETARPLLPGMLNGNQAFEDFRDADDRVGPYVELFLSDEYHWIPWEMVKLLSMEQPRKLRHLLWAPVQITLHSGGALVGVMPVLYVNSHLHRSDEVKLGRRTEWDESNGFAAGAGQRVFFAGPQQPALFEIRELEFDDAPPAENPE